MEKSPCAVGDRRSRAGVLRCVLAHRLYRRGEGGLCSRGFSTVVFCGCFVSVYPRKSVDHRLEIAFTDEVIVL